MDLLLGSFYFMQLLFSTGCHILSFGFLWSPTLQLFWFSTASFLIYLVFYTGCQPFLLWFPALCIFELFSYVFHLLFFLSVFHPFSIFFYFPLVSTSFSISVAQLHHKNSDLIDLTGQDIHLYY